MPKKLFKYTFIRLVGLVTNSSIYKIAKNIWIGFCLILKKNFIEVNSIYS